LQKDVLDPDEAILQFMVTRSRTYIFALDKQRFYTYSVEYADKDLERDVEALTRPLHRADTQSSWDPSVAYKLYSKIIYPVEGFLIGKKTVVIIPHGPLSAVPFEILVDSKAHANKRFWSAQERPSYLVEKYAFSYCPSIAVLSQTRTRDRKERPGWNLAAFGDAVYQVSDKKKEANPGSERILASLTSNAKDSRNAELKQLPGARREISEITRILGGPSSRRLI
jgi:CHAT domain-containing protein